LIPFAPDQDKPGPDGVDLRLDYVSETIQLSVRELYLSDEIAYLRAVSGIMSILATELRDCRAGPAGAPIEPNAIRFRRQS
jgi:hypothetical protein